MGRLWLLLILPLLSFCGGYEYPAVQVLSEGGEVKLLTQTITRHATAKLRISCNNQTSFKITLSTVTATANDPDWSGCLSGSYNFNLSEGPLLYKVWFKDSENKISSKFFEANFVGSTGTNPISTSMYSTADQLGDLNVNRATILENGLIVAMDHSANINLGRGHIFSPAGRELRVFAPTNLTANDRFGSDGVYPLSGGRFLVSTPVADHGAAATNEGRIDLYESTYDLSSNTLVLSHLKEIWGLAHSVLGRVNSFGSTSGITTFPNLERIVVACPFCDDAGANSGKVLVYDYDLNFKYEIVGDAGGAQLGYSEAENIYGVMKQGDYFSLTDYRHDENTNTNAGRVRLYSPLASPDSTGEVDPIGVQVVGSTNAAFLGSGGVYKLRNGSYAVLSPQYEIPTTGNKGKIHILSENFVLQGTIENPDSVPAKLGDLTQSSYSIQSLFPFGSGEDFGIISLGVSGADALLNRYSKPSMGTSESLTVLKLQNTHSAKVLALSTDLIFGVFPEYNPAVTGAAFFINPSLSPTSGSQLSTPGIPNYGARGVVKSEAYGYCATLTGINIQGRIDIFKCEGAEVNSVSTLKSSFVSPLLSRTAGSTAFGGGGSLAHPKMKVFLVSDILSRSIHLIPYD